MAIAEYVRFVPRPYRLAAGVCVLIALHLIPTALLQTANDSTRTTYCNALALCEVGMLSWWVAVGCRNIVLALAGWIAGLTAALAFSIHPFLIDPTPFSPSDVLEIPVDRGIRWKCNAPYPFGASRAPVFLRYRAFSAAKAWTCRCGASSELRGNRRTTAHETTILAA